ncbi:hypothetical protein AAE02nite_26210 [Adhaeribacter aerolatus]|uniref:Lipoprotein n=1 Tax=Adhaeribacter aerolatus TaxID=670289 RepID=A0A512AZK7_9BACT|nr:hypothetical protein [Adhaeribacter aerolatus]GEO04957.1 hypothetical protein AAE02nite_26210 [Adhaeribacter aerolatus]
MKLNQPFFTSLLILLVLNGCTTQSQVSQPTEPAAIPLAANPNFEVDNNVSAAGNNKIRDHVQKLYNRQVDVLDVKTPDEMAIYSQLVDVPDKTTYAVAGNPLTNVDTLKFKTDGFVNRRLAGLAYLHKRGVNRKDKIISAEYLFTTDDGYYYLLGYAPVPHLIMNEEDVIIAQDSLNRKSTGLMRTLIKK